MIEANSISEAWEKSIIKLLKEGKWIPTQRGFQALEICNLHFFIDNPFHEPIISPNYGFGEDFINNYLRSHEKSYEEESIKKRIFEYGEKNINQLNNVIRVLKKDWYSRRAVISTIIPGKDLSMEHFPCVSYLQFLIRDNKVHLFSVLRSNDAWLAALPDMISLSNFQKFVAEKLNLPIGTYSQVSVSYHLYEPDYQSAMNNFNQN